MFQKRHDAQAVEKLREWARKHPQASDSELDAAAMILYRNLHAQLFTPYAETAQETQNDGQHKHA